MERNCPLCNDPKAHAIELPELKARQIECPNCTTYEITDRLEKLLADEPAAKPRIPYLSDAARRATTGGRCLNLTEENYLREAYKEEGLQQGGPRGWAPKGH